MSTRVRMFLASRLFSLLGNWMMILTLGMWGKELTGSNTLAGVCVAAIIAPRLLGIVAGSILDRIPRKTALLISDLGTAALVPVLAVVDTRNEYWILVAFGLAYGTLGVLQAAAPGAIKALCTGEEMPKAVSIYQAMSATLVIVGPLLGAALFTSYPPYPLLALLGGSLLAGGAILATVRIPVEDAPVTGGVWEGLRLIWSSFALRTAVVALVLSQSVAGLVDGSLYALLDALHLPSNGAGIIVGIQGVGMLVGALAGRVATTTSRALTAVGIGLGGTGVVALGIAASIGLVWPPFVLIGIAGGLLGLVQTAFAVLVQRETKQQVIGRVQAAIQAFLAVPGLASVLLGALLVAAVPVTTLYVVIGAVMVVVGAWVVARRRS